MRERDPALKRAHISARDADNSGISDNDAVARVSKLIDGAAATIRKGTEKGMLAKNLQQLGYITPEIIKESQEAAVKMFASVIDFVRQELLKKTAGAKEAAEAIIKLVAALENQG